jgi:Kef-type K+ transport system membrane component KefB
MQRSSLRWGRIVLGGVLGELVLIVPVIPLRAANASESAVTALAVVGSFVAFVPVAWWLGRRLGRPVLHGALMGAFAAAVYTVLFVVGRTFDPTVPAMPLLYYVAHGMKLAGGALGGWLAQRSA